jgi:hypothetical protein
VARVFKIVVTGPFNSGKTTFIGAISEIEVVATERATDQGGEVCSTTVAMDFGRITLPEGDVIHLYGTPSQQRFDFMWDVLSRGMLGYVVLIDGSSPESLPEAGEIIRAFARRSEVPYVVGLTRADEKNCMAPETVAGKAGLFGDVDIVPCDARKLDGVKSVLIALLERVMEQAGAEEQAG